MEFGDPESEWSLISQQPPPFVSLSPFPATVSPSPRRLSSCFTEPSRPIRAARKLAWISLQGRIIGAEEASSAKTMARENRVLLGPKEAVAWELFSPIHRILIVSVIAVAAANSKRNKQILHLKKAVELRDQVLLSMQEKLDNLCEQVNYFKDQPEAVSDKYVCHLCQQHKLFSNLVGDTAIKASSGDEMFKCKWPPASDAEPEERRMSDLSDWASSVTSSVDIQLNSLAIEQDIYNLRKECEDKDVKIKDLSTYIHSSESFGSKRIAELEDVIRRKSTIITKLKKDVLILEQKVVNLTRDRRPSFSVAISNDRQFPKMADNLVYDMDSTTGPSSSDSDSGPVKKPQIPKAIRPDTCVSNFESTSRGEPKLEQTTKSSASPSKTPANHHWKSRSSSPLKEKSLNQIANAVPIPRPRLTSSSEHCKTRRRPPPRSKDVILQKRWI